MFNVGFPELLMIFLVVLIFYGPGKLPQVGSAIGRGIAEFKKAARSLDPREDDPPPPPRLRAPDPTGEMGGAYPAPRVPPPTPGGETGDDDRPRGPDGAG